MSTEDQMTIDERRNDSFGQILGHFGNCRG
jgi:hypothetical protein